MRDNLIKKHITNEGLDKLFAQRHGARINELLNDFQSLDLLLDIFVADLIVQLELFR